MTTIPANTLSPELFARGSVRANSQFNRALVFAVALYLAVAMIESLIIGLAAPGIAEVGSLYVTTT